MSVYHVDVEDDDDKSDVVSYIESVLDLGLEKHSPEEYLALVEKQ